jgi:hypothetical protein
MVGLFRPIGHDGREEALVARSWAVLTVMLAVLLAPAPALLAQEAPASAGSEVEATGYLSPVYPRDAYSHLLNDETTGATYFARSEDVDLDSYDDGQRVAVTGTLVIDEGYPEPILQVTGVESAEDPSPSETATLTFELSVEGDPPSDATFFGTVRGEGPRYVPLTDEDGDGLYTGSTTVARFPPGTRPLPPDPEAVSLPVQMVQGTGTQGSDESGSLRPGKPTSVIEDFGPVRAEDRTLSASVSFEEDRGDNTTPGPSGGTSGGDGSDDGLLGGAVNSIRGLLPGTGGAAILALIGAGFLLAGGLLTRRLFR